MNDEHKAFSSKEAQRVYFDSAPIGIAHLSESGRFTSVNERLVEMLGYSRLEFLDMDMDDITHKDDRDNDEIMFRESVNGVCPDYGMSKKLIHKEGQFVPVKMSMKRTPREGNFEMMVSFIEPSQPMAYMKKELINGMEQYRQAVPIGKIIQDNKKAFGIAAGVAILMYLGLGEELGKLILEVLGRVLGE